MGLGGKPLNIPLKNVLESLQTHHNVTAAARELRCSPSYIFSVLKKKGMRLLREAGLAKAAAGLTSLDEVLAVTMEGM